MSAHAWIQSTKMDNRDEMEKRIKSVTEKFTEQQIPCPDYWGGYAVIPFEYEFFQARRWRRHDRLLYTRDHKMWNITRLAP